MKKILLMLFLFVLASTFAACEITGGIGTGENGPISQAAIDEITMRNNLTVTYTDIYESDSETTEEVTEYKIMMVGARVKAVATHSYNLFTDYYYYNGSTYVMDRVDADLVMKQVALEKNQTILSICKALEVINTIQAHTSSANFTVLANNITSVYEDMLDIFGFDCDDLQEQLEDKMVQFSVLVENDTFQNITLDLKEGLEDVFTEVKSITRSISFDFTPVESVPSSPASSTEVNYLEVAKAYINRYIQEGAEVYSSVTLPLVHETYDEISYSYVSSDDRVFSEEGLVERGTQDENITLTVTIYKKDSILSTYEIHFVVKEQMNNSIGDGSQANPLYGGKCTSMNITVIEMHQQYGDSILVKCGDFEMLVDAGDKNDGSYVKSELKNQVTDGNLDLLISTHAHSDHIGGMPTALQGVNSISAIVDFGYTRTEDNNYNNYASARDKFIREGASYCRVKDAVDNVGGCSSRMYLMQNVYIDFLNTNQYSNTTSSGHNGQSVTFILTFNDFKFYSSGDLDSNGENGVRTYNNLSEVTMFKATHHCSSNGNTTALLNVLKPQIVVISGASQSLNTHPNQTSLSRIYASSNIRKNLQVYMNAVNGTITATTTGENAVPLISCTITNTIFSETDWFKQNRTTGL